MRWNHAFDGKFSVGDQAVAPVGVIDHGQLFSLKKRGKDQFRDILGQGGDGGEHQSRGAADIQGQRQGHIALFRGMIVKSASLVNLPVNTGGGVIKALNAVHAEIVALPFRVFGVDQRQGDESATIRMPGGEHGQLGEACRSLAALENRRGFDGL